MKIVKVETPKSSLLDIYIYIYIFLYIYFFNTSIILFIDSKSLKKIELLCCLINDELLVPSNCDAR